jgi:hypothetical protein
MIKELLLLISWLFSGTPKKYSELIAYRMKHFPWSGYSAMSWCGRLVHKKEDISGDTELWNHESIHLMQAKSHFCWPTFYLSYLWSWLIGAVWMFDWWGGYYTTPYEMEAYANEDKPDYWKTYTTGSMKRYKFSVSERARLWKSVGKNRREWKKYIKTL